MTQMLTQEADHLAADLQLRHIRVQVQPIDTLDLERHMTLEHVVDVRHARHAPMVNAEGGLCPPGLTTLDGGRPGGGPDPLPLMCRLFNLCAVGVCGGHAYSCCCCDRVV